MKAILYINQFFGQIGGEEFAGHEPEIREGIVGPGMAYAKALKDEKPTKQLKEFLAF